MFQMSVRNVCILLYLFRPNETFPTSSSVPHKTRKALVEVWTSLLLTALAESLSLAAEVQYKQGEDCMQGRGGLAFMILQFYMHCIKL